jgi:thiamine kinase-like enzyme
MLCDNPHGLVITHGDFCRENVLYVDPDTLVLIDWENSGVYPSYWEFVEAHFSLDPKSEWGQYLPKILEPAYTELGAFWRLWVFLG